MTMKRKKVYCTHPGCTHSDCHVQSAHVRIPKPPVDHRSPLYDSDCPFPIREPLYIFGSDLGWRRRHPSSLGLHARDLRGPLILPRAQPGCSRPSRGTILKSKREKFEKGRKGKEFQMSGNDKELVLTLDEKVVPLIARFGGNHKSDARNGPR